MRQGIWIWPHQLNWDAFAYLKECGFDGPVNLNFYDWITGETVFSQWPAMLDKAALAGMPICLQTGEIGLTNPGDCVELLRAAAFHPALHSIVIFDEPAWRIEKQGLRGYTHENFSNLVKGLRKEYPHLKLNVVQAGAVMDDTFALKQYSSEVDFIGADNYEDLGPSTMRRLSEVSLGKPIYAVLKYANDRDVNNLKAAIQGAYDGGALWCQWYAEPSDKLTIDSPAWKALLEAVKWANLGLSTSSDYTAMDTAARNMVAAWR